MKLKKLFLLCSASLLATVCIGCSCLASTTTALDQSTKGISADAKTKEEPSPQEREEMSDSHEETISAESESVPDEESEEVEESLESSDEAETEVLASEQEEEVASEPETNPTAIKENGSSSVHSEPSSESPVQPSAPVIQPTPNPTSTSTASGTNNQCKEHDFTYTEPIPATCTEYGQCHWACGNCDFTFDVPLSPTGHDWDNGQVTTPPTCGSNGVKTFTCRNCKLTRTETITAQESHNYISTSTVAQTKIGTMADLGYTIYTCTGCGATMKSDYEGYLDCEWRYQAVNEYRTGAGRFLLNSDGSKVYYNQDGCAQLQPFTRAEGLENIAKTRAKQEAYDIAAGLGLSHDHNGKPWFYYYGTAYFSGSNAECCEAGGSELDQYLDSTYRCEESSPYELQGHLRIVLNSDLKYIGTGAYVYKGYLVTVSEYSDVPN